MLNSGAMMTSAIVSTLIEPSMKNSEKFDYVLQYMKVHVIQLTVKNVLLRNTFIFLQKFAGGEFLGFNNAVFMSERETADRNMAMAYYMKENRCFPPKTRLLDIMDLYFQVRVKKGPKILHFTTYTCTVLYSDLFHGGNDGIVSIIKILRLKFNSFD